MAAVSINNFDWNMILGLRVWTPLTDLRGTFFEVFDGVYQIEKNIFIKTQKYNRDFLFDDPKAPFITKIYWAVDLNVLMNCIFNSIKGDNILCNISAPEILLSGTQGTYGELVIAAHSMGYKNERAIYSNKGDFLYKEVNIDRLSYCFLSHEEKNDERPGMIEIALLKN